MMLSGGLNTPREEIRIDSVGIERSSNLSVKTRVSLRSADRGYGGKGSPG